VARLESKETRTLIFDALRSLPPEQREVMALRDVEEEMKNGLARRTPSKAVSCATSP
jgi:DNA-directed RNA polymerase specialized sigma24 family protein